MYLFFPFLLKSLLIIFKRPELSSLLFDECVPVELLGDFLILGRATDRPEGKTKIPWDTLGSSIRVRFSEFVDSRDQWQLTGIRCMLVHVRLYPIRIQRGFIVGFWLCLGMSYRSATRKSEIFFGCARYFYSSPVFRIRGLRDQWQLTGTCCTLVHVLLSPIRIHKIFIVGSWRNLGTSFR